MAKVQNVLKVARDLWLEAWYDRELRLWTGIYRDEQGHQRGACWFGNTRDEILLFRPQTSTIEE